MYAAYTAALGCTSWEFDTLGGGGTPAPYGCCMDEGCDGGGGMLGSDALGGGGAPYAGTDGGGITP